MAVVDSAESEVVPEFGVPLKSVVYSQYAVSQFTSVCMVERTVPYQTA